MKLKQTFKYNFFESFKPFLIACGLLAFLQIMPLFFMPWEKPGTVMSSGGFDFSVLIVALVMAISTVNEGLPMMLQNGISRRTLYVSKLSWTVVFSVLYTVASMVISLIAMGLFSILGYGDSYIIETVFTQLYCPNNPALSFANLHIYLSLFFVATLFVVALGTFIGLLSNRLGKYGKVAIFAGIPCAFFIVLPIIDITFFNEELMYRIFKFIADVFGVFTGQYLNGVGCFAVLFVVFAVATYFVMRKMPLKK